MRCGVAGAAMLLALLAAPVLAGEEVVLVSGGKARAALVLPAEPSADEKLAAQEIQHHIQAMSGAKLAVVGPADVPGGLLPVRIGLSLTPEAEAVIRARGEDPAALLVRVRPDGVALAGLSPEGTLFAAYELLEQLGCRWFMPGEIGTVIPQRPTVALAPQETVQVPDFAHRHLQNVAMSDPWYRRARLGGFYFPSAHGFPIQADTGREPELFALVGGRRTASQWCVSNPEVVRRVAEAAKAYFRAHPDAPGIGMGPNDGGGFCECQNCRALDGGDWDPFSSDVSVTDRYMHFFNAVLEEVHREFPGKKLYFYCYHAYMRPPMREKPDPCIVPAFAPITLCRVHGMNNPLCPDRSYYRYIMTEWGKLLPEIFERGYFFNLACPGFPFSKVQCIRDEIPFARRAGIKGWRVECMPSWGIYTPTLYVATRLFWDADRDVDALLDDFYAKFFGPAAGPMKRYLERMDAALRDCDFHTGCSFNMPDFYPPEVRKAGRKDLDRAARTAGDTVYGRRVAIYRLVFDALEAFVEMLDRRNEFDFEAAHKALVRLKELQDKGIAHDPPVFYAGTARSYLDRFYAACTDEGYERTTGGNELVAGMPDRWDFLLDSARVGEALGYFRADLKGGNWQKLATMSASWGDQGLRYYKGDAWYRAAVKVPTRFKGRKVMLWFGGVDERTKVWVNGALVGESASGSFVPFEFDASGAVRSGEENLVAVRVTNLDLDELGTGGITAPVMFWSPVAQTE